MSLQWLDAKYVALLSFRLRNFKRKGSAQSWNFSCPVCGDSPTNKSKARGYVFPSKGKLLYHCHNCGVTMDVPRLVKFLDQTLFDEYVKEKLTADPEANKQREERDAFTEKMKKPSFIKDTPLKSLKKISQLSVDHPVKLYVEKRLIPPEYHHKLFLCKGFKAWVNSFVPGKFDSVDIDEPRLIIPFIDREGNLYGLQGRSFKKNTSLRYITIMLDEDMPKLYGLDSVNVRKHIYAIEGPIDSMFIPNSVASAGGDILTDLGYLSNDKKLFTIVYDNEKRNSHTVKKMDKAIEEGFRVCIWPPELEQKDINDMVLSGISRDKLVDIISENSYTGLDAKLALSIWRRS